MSVKIRLKRIGAKKKAVYRVVVTDERTARDGRVIEELGSYDPNQTSQKVSINVERAKYWVGKGAVATKTVGNILKSQSVL
ncbi:MAG: 30S ribosomal protein S16 [Candidatus Kappaea frigidicola]|nr:30S ribosomal protein S16 [Candidatus Kappaea frigidicola]